MTHWLEHLFAPKSLLALKKERWKILREGGSIGSLENSAQPVNGLEQSWQVQSQHGSVEVGSIKCLLQSTEHGDRCEMVVLFPGTGKGSTGPAQRATVCVSSQVGCGVGCKFCATGTMGLQRNLTVWEILEQVYIARCIALRHGRHLRNVVYMGMGEPLHNTPAVFESLKWLIADSGFGIAPRHITVSTSGVRAAMLNLARTFPQVRVALSLHASNETLRRSLMPRVANDLAAMRQTLREVNDLQFPVPVWLEYILIAGLNDADQDAQRLIEFCNGLQIEVNLIPYNPIAGTGALGWNQPDKDVRIRFASKLRQAGIKTTVRHSYGQQESAACGQLVVTNR